MHWLLAPDAWLSRWLIERLLGGIYAIAFLVAANQFPALLGEKGLLPAPDYLSYASAREEPSLFHWHYSDRFFVALSWLGVVLALSLVVGLPQSGPAWVPMLVWFALWALYLSIVNIGQTFYGFGWESLLLEAGFLAIFLGPARSAPPVTILWLFRWLLFRVEFGAGLIKLRGDRCWRDLTCLYYHHETQPMPNPLSWYFHHLPRPLHKVEVAGNHLLQLVVPFLLFAPQPVASIAAYLFLVHQCWLLLSGNFSWLNVITLTLAVAALDDAHLGALHALKPGTLEATPLWFLALVLACTALFVALSYWPVKNLFSRRQRMNFSFNPFHLMNTYGAFGSITKTRYEVILEGTRDELPTETTVWKEYEFKGKPGDPKRRPPQIAPYHLRLDWLMWFAAFSMPEMHPWIFALAEKLLVNDRPTLKLIRHNPFPLHPPRLIRASLYRYRFTTWRERRETGAWWSRERVRTYFPPIQLRG